MGEIFNAVLKNKLTEWAERTASYLSHNLVFEKKQKNYTDCVFILNALIKQAKISKTNLFICFVDFRKAFDSVDHSSLWNRLIYLTGDQSTVASNTATYVKQVLV